MLPGVPGDRRRRDKVASVNSQIANRAETSPVIPNKYSCAGGRRPGPLTPFFFVPVFFRGRLLQCRVIFGIASFKEYGRTQHRAAGVADEPLSPRSHFYKKTYQNVCQKAVGRSAFE